MAVYIQNLTSSAPANFQLEIEHEYLKGYRRSWNDGKQQRLEELIEDISVGLSPTLLG